MKTLIPVLAFLCIGSYAFAQTPPTNVYGVDFTANNAQPVSAAGHLRLRYNSGTNVLEQSIAGAAYTSIGGGSVFADSPLTGNGTGGSHLACPSCLVGTPSATGDIMYSTAGGQSFTPLADIAVNNVLLSGGVGAAPSWGKVANAALTNSSVTINSSSPLAGGGSVSLGGTLTLTCTTCITGTPTATGDLIYSTAGGQAMTKLPDVAAGSYLLSGGIAAAPLWSTLTLPNAATTGDILYGNATNAIGRLADVAVNQVLLSGGVGAAPAYGTVPSAAISATGVVAATYGDSTHVGVFTVNAAGQLTAASNVSITSGVTTISGTSPIVASASTGAVTLSCPSCVVLSPGAQQSGFISIASSGTPLLINNNGLSTSNGIGASLQNTTAGTGGTQFQYAPGLEMIGQVFDTNAAVSKQTKFMIQNQPDYDVGSLMVFSRLTFLSSVNGSGYIDILDVHDNGSVIFHNTPVPSTPGMTFGSSTSPWGVIWDQRLLEGTNDTILAIEGAIQTQNASTVNIRFGNQFATTNGFLAAFNTSTGGGGTDVVKIDFHGNVIANALVAPTAGPSTSQQHTIPAVTSDTFALLAASQVFTNKTLTTPVINGATSASGNFDLSGSNGTFKTTTGAVTLGNGAVGVTGQATFSAGILASGATAIDFSGGSGAFKTTTGASSFVGSSNTFSNPAILPHVQGNGGTPTCVLGSAAGTVGTSCSVTGTDLEHEIIIVTGSVAGSGNTVATITYATTYPNDSVATCYPQDNATANAFGFAQTAWYAATAGSYTINRGAAFVSSTTLTWSCGSLGR